MEMLYTVLLIAAVVVAAYVLIKILAAPIKKIFKLLINAVCGFALLFLANFVGGFFDFSIPVNILNPIPGTPYEHNPRLTEDEIRRILAVFRFLIPDGSIRMAGGRGLLEDKGRKCFQSGANAAISGDMLTTSGITIERDMKMLDDLGYVPRRYHG